MRVCIKGKRYSRSTRTKDKDKAERLLQRFLAPLGLGENRLPLADVWLEYVKSPNRNELASSTLNAKRLVWMHFAKWMEQNHLEVSDLGGVTAEAIAEYLACLRADICATTYNGRVCVLREIFRVLAGKAGLEDDPWEGVRLRPDDAHSRRELTLVELERLLEAAKKVSWGAIPPGRMSVGPVRGDAAGQDARRPTAQSNNLPDWHTLFLIGIYTGLRLGDCCKLDWSQVNLVEGVIQLVPRKTRRHHQRMVTIPIHPALEEALGEVRRARCPSAQCEAVPTGRMPVGPLNGPVLPEIAEGYRRSRWWVSHEIAKIFKAANIEMSVKLEGRRTRTPEATFHSLRHTFVSLAANAGVPLHIVQSIVGHESTSMTRHYYHENAEALKSAVAAIPTLTGCASVSDTSVRHLSVRTSLADTSVRPRRQGVWPTRDQLAELAQVYSQLKRIFESGAGAARGAPEAGRADRACS